jgi:hypothetical protein
MTISKYLIELDTNDIEILVYANDDNLYTTNHGQMMLEVLVSCRDIDVEINARKLSRLG